MDALMEQGRKLVGPIVVLLVLVMMNNCDGSGASTREMAGKPGLGLTDSTQIEQPERPTIEPARRTASLSVDQLLAQMSLEEKIGQLLFVRARGYFQNDESDEFTELKAKVDSVAVGGILFFKGTIYGQAVLTNKLQKRSRIPLWISQDMEFGAAMRVEGTTRLTPAMGIGATGNPNMAYWAGRITAQEAMALGVHQIYAPVLDVNNNPRNPVINTRSFSGNAEQVAQFGTRFIEGVAETGVKSTAKHFPGHGNTETDSHYALPVIRSNYSSLNATELVPFRAAIDEGVPAIMSAHINFPNISRYGNRPGTLDPSVLNRLLVDSLGFPGMIMTDGLEMSGIANYYSAGQAAKLALQAGADVLLLSPDELSAIETLKEAVQSGEITEQRLDVSVRKLLQWKKQAGLFEQAHVPIDSLSARIQTPKNRYWADVIARASVTMLRNERSIIPLSVRRFPRLLVLSVADDRSGQTGRHLASQVRKYHPQTRFEIFDSRSSAAEMDAIIADARWADVILIGSYVRINSRGSDQFSSRQQRFLNRLPAGTPQILLALDNPYVFENMPDAEAQLIAWSDDDHQISQTVPALFGRSAIMGRLPIDIPKLYNRGTGIAQPNAAQCYDAPGIAGLNADSLQKVDAIMQQAIRESTFPGGVVGVVKNGVLGFCGAYGWHTYDKKRAVAPNDVYDLASLTKMVATTSAMMKLVDEGRLSLSDPVGNYISTYKSGQKSRVTIRQLLFHTAGLPAFRVYVDSLQTPAQIIEAVKNEPLIKKPGTEYTYSDLGFILLGEIIKTVTGEPLDTYTRQTFFEPIGMRYTHFNPKSVGSWYAGLIPPTEIDQTFRNKTIQAEVHDERAWYLDGVAGHAGLFSNIQDLAQFAQLLLNNGRFAGHQYISPQTVRQFTQAQSPLHNRGLGFDRKSAEGFSSAGTLASPNTFGHLGFTGTSLWVDPDNDIAIIMLTNRTFPSRTYGETISRVRAAVADAVLSSITPK